MSVCEKHVGYSISSQYLIKYINGSKTIIALLLTAIFAFGGSDIIANVTGKSKILILKFQKQ